jgi:CHAT domain-containing protein
LVVPSGSLQSLPFSLLVASAPPEIKSDADYRLVEWLEKRYAFSVLPSVSSIQAFRQFAKGGSAKEPFAGFGDPLIGGSESSASGERGKIDIAAVYRGLATATNDKLATTALETEIADVEAIRQAPRLEETADELRAMAKTLRAGANSLWLQAQATETIIKSLDLSQFQTIAFATHGVMAGEVNGVEEPGLILTPPRQRTLEDDG